MKTLKQAGVQPLDLILFSGTDAVSRTIRFLEQKHLGSGDYSHAGLAVSREVLDLPFLEPGRIYVWESTLTAARGFLSNYTDRIANAELPDEGHDPEVTFGVQLRDLELVIPGYEVGGGAVGWAAYRGERLDPGETRKHLMALYEEYGHAPYTSNLLDVFGAIYPAALKAADFFDRVEDRVVHFRRHLQEKMHKPKELADAEHHMFCSEWVATVYKRLGIIDVPDPRLVAPTAFLVKTDVFHDPVPLVPEDSDRESA
jgi:hypothetical protein